jgi:hypothetical protein
MYVYAEGPTRVHRARALASRLVGAVLPELHAAAARRTTAATVPVNEDANRSDMTTGRRLSVGDRVYGAKPKRLGTGHAPRPIRPVETHPRMVAYASAQPTPFERRRIP